MEDASGRVPRAELAEHNEIDLCGYAPGWHSWPMSESA
jgi:hypothetical protein